MKKYSIVILSFAILIVTAVFACNSNDAPSKNNEGMTVEVTQDSLIKHGEYLVSIMGCHDCHSPKVMTPQGPAIDTAHMLAGHLSNMPLPPLDPNGAKGWVMFSPTLTAMVGPWGISYSANLTSDASGIGNWTEAQFFKSIREGKLKGMDNTRPLLPPMPWQMIAKASDHDLKSIFAYLKSTPPVENVVPSPVPPGQLAKLQTN
jgi:hypothetical protein